MTEKEPFLQNLLKNHKYELMAVLLFILGWALRFNIDGLFSYPGNIKAADPMFHTNVAQSIVDSESYGQFLPYMVEGHKDIVNMYPPIDYLATAGLVKLSGAQAWNVMYLLITLFDAFGILLLFILCSRIFQSKKIGLLAAALYVMPMPLANWWYNMSIGIWNNVGGLFFFFAALWLAYEYFIEPKRWKALCLGIIIAATWLVHIAELYIVAFFVAAVGVKILLKVKPLKEKLVHLALVSIIPLVNIVLFWPKYKVWSSFAKFGFSWNLAELPKLSFFTTVWDFKIWILLLFLLGAVLLALNFRKYKLLAVSEAYLLTYLMVLPLFLSSYYFFVRQRIALPFVIAPVVALGIYFIISTLGKKIKINSGYLLLAVVLLLLIVPIGQYISLRKDFSYQHLTPEKYSALVWIQDNTPKDAEFLFLTGYYQTSSQYSKRVGFVLDAPKLGGVVEEFGKTGELPLMNLEDHGDTVQAMAYEKSFFNYGLYEERDSAPMNYSEFDYVVLNDFAPQIKPFNDAVIGYLENKSYAEVYKKNSIVILKRPE